MSEFPVIDRSWTLFLDRDGVINHEKQNDYVYNYSEFIFYPGALDALRLLAERFGRIIIITNQRGVEKKLMTEDDLILLHGQMVAAVEEHGGKIDAIYYCTSLENNHPDRKPQPGMALKAKKSFPEIDFRKTFMVGNNISDMQFGKNAGTLTAFVLTTSPDQVIPHESIDFHFKDLAGFANAVESQI